MANLVQNISIRAAANRGALARRQQNAKTVQEAVLKLSSK
jgi:hypothetical protein